MQAIRAVEMAASGIKNKTELLLAILYATDARDAASARPTPVVGITRLEKLIFLAKMEQGLLNAASDEKDFHFVPFRMGPWTQEVYDEVDFLESIGLLEKEQRAERSPEDEAHNDELFSELVLNKYQQGAGSSDETTDAFQLTEVGKRKAAEIWAHLSKDEQQKLITLKRRFNNMNLRQFLRYVYQKYPEYAEASEIREYLNA
jgi:hypothetical protein